MSARSKARKQTLDILYEADIRGTQPLDILASRDVTEEGPDARPIRDYTRELITGVSEHRRKIDELIATYAQGWDMDRLPAVDRNIMRLALFEILWPLCRFGRATVRVGAGAALFPADQHPLVARHGEQLS